MSRDSQMGEPSLVGRYARPLLAVVLTFACVSFSIIWIDEPIFRRAMIVAGVCLTLWLTEVVPPYVPTFVLWALTPLLLHGFGDRFQLTRVLGWSANPVLALFLGGFALSVAASRYGIDSLIARLAVRTGTGLNAIAIAAISSTHAITFTGWMLFAFPLALGLLIAGVVVLLARIQVRGATTELPNISVKAPDLGGRLVMIVFFATVAAWLREPFHGVSSAKWG